MKLSDLQKALLQGDADVSVDAGSFLAAAVQTFAHARRHVTGTGTRRVGRHVLCKKMEKKREGGKMEAGGKGSGRQVNRVHENRDTPASLSHFSSRGLSLHMFLKLRFKASKREMVVWLKSLP